MKTGYAVAVIVGAIAFAPCTRRTATVLIIAYSLAVAAALECRAQVPSYCSDLTQVVGVAMTKRGFGSIAGQPREGNFREAALPLADWKDCSLYGAGAYTCDSFEMGTAEEAESAQSATLSLIKACLGQGWSEAADRSSPNYVVLHHALRPVSITLSTDKTGDSRHVLRLTVFVRRN